MLNKQGLSISAISILALTLSGCANQNTQGALDTTQSSIHSAQSAVDTAQAVKDNGLAGALSSELGVNSVQAAGGAGALFQAAQANMTANDFQQLTQSVPEINTLIGSAPKTQTDGLSQLASGASALMGDKDNNLGKAATLVNSFQELGLSADMVSQYVPVVTNYVSQNATPYLTKALISALTGL